MELSGRCWQGAQLLPHPTVSFLPSVLFVPPPQVTAIMGQLAKNVPMHTWLAALPQLISRVCHPCKEVSELAKSIIVRITQVGNARL